jgi:hypothetical protein
VGDDTHAGLRPRRVSGQVPFTEPAASVTFAAASPSSSRSSISRQRPAAGRIQQAAAVPIAPNLSRRSAPLWRLRSLLPDLVVHDVKPVLCTTHETWGNRCFGNERGMSFPPHFRSTHKPLAVEVRRGISCGCDCHLRRTFICVDLPGEACGGNARSCNHCTRRYRRSHLTWPVKELGIVHEQLAGSTTSLGRLKAFQRPMLIVITEPEAEDA